ncbi:Os05g0406550, partial [Oryza sativa Japonica Group]
RQGRRGAAAAAAEGVDDGKVDILSFDVANAMSRAANLYPLAVGHRGGAAAHLLCLGSQAVRALVPGDDSWLLALTLAEKLDALNRVAEVATRLGRRCMLQALLGFDHVYADLLAGCSDAVAISSR